MGAARVTADTLTCAEAACSLGYTRHSSQPLKLIITSARLSHTSAPPYHTRISTMSPIAIDAQPVPSHVPSKTTQPIFHQTTSDLPKNPLERTWRGDKEGKLRIEAYPSFMNATDEAGLLEKRQWVREHLAVAFRFWGKMGYGEGIR